MAGANHMVPVGILSPIMRDFGARGRLRRQLSPHMEPQAHHQHRRIARELAPGMLVNLGHRDSDAGRELFATGRSTTLFQSKWIRLAPALLPEEGMAHPMLTDAAGHPVTALPGASAFDSAMSFGLIRGGHLDLTVLGGLQVDQVRPPGQLDDPEEIRSRAWVGRWISVCGAKRVIVAMQHTAKGRPKIVKQCSLPVTAVRPVDLVVTEMAVVAFRRRPCNLHKDAEYTLAEIVAATEAGTRPPRRRPGKLTLRTKTAA